MKKRIAIIGGGIAGITCGAALLKEGYEADIFEQAKEIKEIGAVLAVLPNGMAVINELDLCGEVLGKGGEIRSMIVKEPSGTTIQKGEFDYKYPCVVIRRSDLLNALLTKIDRSRIFTDHRLAQYQRTQEGKLLLQFENGNTYEYDVIIGADGINSVVRKHLIGDQGLVYRGYPLWRGVSKIIAAPDHSSETWGSKKRFGLYPIRDNWVGWWAALEEPKDLSDDPQGAKNKLLEQFKEFHHPILEAINNTDHIIKTAIVDREPYKKWHDDQSVIIGDAAHCTTPNLGQGANMAMESAILLARCIGKYGPVNKAFHKYEDLRFKRTSDINKQSLLVGQIGFYRSPVAVFFRNLMFRMIPSWVLKKTYDVYYNYDVTRVNIE